MSGNHIALHLATKGIFDPVANITKGMLILLFEVVFKKRGGGAQRAPLIYDNRPEFFQELKLFKETEIDYINVYVNWNKSKPDYKIEATLLKKQIEAEILHEVGKKINIQIMQKPE